MKKQLFLVLAILFSPVFLSCSNDNDSNSNENVIPEGEETWVGCSIELNNVAELTKATGDKEDAIGNESQIKKAVLILFKEDGTIEQSVAMNVPGNSNVIPAEAIPTKSGAKKLFYVILNYSDALKTAIDKATSKSELDDIVVSLGTQPNRISVPQTGVAPVKGNYDYSSFGVITDKEQESSDVVALTGLLMSACQASDVQAGVSKGEAESVGGRNHILIKVDRNMAKVSLHNKKGDNSTEAEFESTEGQNKIGVVTGVNYAIDNISGQSTLGRDADMRRFPPYNFTTAAQFASLYDEGQPFKDLGTFRYVTENRFNMPYRGNVTYLLIQTNYVPTKFIIGYNQQGTTDKYERADALDTKGKYNYMAVLNENWKTTNEIILIGANSTFDSNTSAIQASAANLIFKKYAETIAYTEVAVDGSVPADGWHAVYNNSKVHPDLKNSWADQVTITKYENGSAIKSHMYGVAFYKNSVCYYRTNITNDKWENLNPDSNKNYFINRNYSYKLNLTGFSGLGFPNEGDVTIDPTVPVGYDTYVQVELEVNPWTSVEYEVKPEM